MDEELLTVHGRIWRQEIPKRKEASYIWKDDTRFRFPTMFRDKDQMVPIDFFLCSIPKVIIEEIVTATNLQLDIISMEHTTYTEVLKYLRIRLAMALDPMRRSIEQYWSEKFEGNFVIVPRLAEKRCKMSL